MKNFKNKKYKVVYIGILCIFIFASCIYSVINIYSKSDKAEGSKYYSDNDGKVNNIKTVCKTIEEKTDKDLHKDAKIKFTEMTNYNIISPSVKKPIKKKLLKSIENMKTMHPGVGDWRIIYCNEDKVIIYNYDHIVACDISENNKGIYGIIELKDLKVGSYQGSETAEIYVSPDAMFCIIGTGCCEIDTPNTKSLYACSLRDSTVKEIAVNYTVNNTKFKWHLGKSSSLKSWYVSIEKNSNKIIWNFHKGKRIDNIPTDAKEQIVKSSYEEKLPIDTGYSCCFWWKRDKNTFIAAPYRKEANSSSDLKLSDFEIVEVKLKEKECRTLFKVYNSQKLPEEPPKLSITIGDKELRYLVSKNKWDGVIYDKKDSFKTLLKKGSKIVPYIEIGETAVINFNKYPPDKVTISDILIDENGMQIYPDETITNIPVNLKDGKDFFEITKNMASNLSSFYVKNKIDTRGFRIIASWGENECEYVFIIRTDAF